MSKQVIIYDDACPLCTAYTKAFVKAGLLADENRVSFSSASKELWKLVDQTKCRNEIPLVNISTGGVLYGIDALLEVLAGRWPFIKTCGNLKPVKYFLKKLYKFISYNRRSIVAINDKTFTVNSAPDFNALYRTAFLCLGFLFNTYMLIPLQRYVLPVSIFKEVSLMQLQIGHLLFVCVNISMASTYKKRQFFEYLAQINMLALISMLFLLPLILINKFINIPDAFNNIYLAGILFFIIKDYFRRMEFAGISFGSKVIYINIFCLVAFIIFIMH